MTRNLSHHHLTENNSTRESHYRFHRWHFPYQTERSRKDGSYQSQHEQAINLLLQNHSLLVAEVQTNLNADVRSKRDSPIRALNFTDNYLLSNLR
ncbi:hypothetical protein TNCT_640081 [Trichonephila clavata]|uniref:Uncharacterized protein n=1 Tax=Trichonephila clavata TaxID=2740835 RepID=A0A8X6K563_TRICU|nr:hypothetical protein TNCT_640081 [Trichonephila clavata]